jgi:hypothetical protein
MMTITTNNITIMATTRVGMSSGTTATMSNKEAGEMVCKMVDTKI